MSAENIPPKLQTIIEDFRESEGREKIELLVEYAERMPGLPQWLAEKHDQMDLVHECMTPVHVEAVAEAVQGQPPRLTFFFDVPAESPTVRGYAAIMAEGVNGSTPEDILNIPGDFYLEMGLHQVLTQQRLNGIGAILAHMKRLALKNLEAGK